MHNSRGRFFIAGLGRNIWLDNELRELERLNNSDENQADFSVYLDPDLYSNEDWENISNAPFPRQQ